MFEPLPDIPGDHDANAPQRWFVVRRGEVLVGDDDALPRASPFDADDVSSKLAAGFGVDGVEAMHVLGRDAGGLVLAHGVAADTEAPAGFRWVDLYSFYGLLGEDLWHLAGRAVQIVEWGRTHRFCGRCGAETERASGERLMQCGDCGLGVYPRLSPAVIMAVHRPGEILLAHGIQFPKPFFSTLAGFVEPGETIEDAVRREVHEEVGITVGAVTYHSSQPWPFPNSLMLGFFAEWESGDIVIDPAEIVEARWFTADDLPMVPGSMSIASKLIESWRTDYA